MKKSASKTRSKELDELLRKIDFADEDFLRAAREQPRLFLKAGDYRVSKMRERMAAENTFKLVRITAENEVRSSFERSGKKMPSSRIISNTVEVRPDVQAARQAVCDAKEQETYARLLVAAFKMRRDAVAIAGRFEPSADGIHPGSSDEVSVLKARLRRRYPNP